MIILRLHQANVSCRPRTRERVRRKVAALHWGKEAYLSCSVCLWDKLYFPVLVHNAKCRAAV